MIARRLGAIVVAVALILGAWLIRDRVIDDDSDDGGSRSGTEIVCVADLRDACAALADERDVDVHIEEAGTTLEALAALEDLADAPIWITMEPLPEMADMLRVIRDAPELSSELTTVASSPITLVMADERATVLENACGEPLDWECVGDAAGDPWVEIGGDESWTDVRPAFAPIESAIGLLGVGQAAAGYFGTSQIQPNDPDFQQWARRLAGAVPASALSGGSAIETIATRPSALDIAVGAAAELPDASASELGLQYADPMIRADVVVAVPDGASLPRGFADDIGRLLFERGWAPPADEPNPLPTPIEMLAVRQAWKDVT